jgi:hypothetical protein
MKAVTLAAVLLAALATGCAQKKQVLQSTEECIAARDAAMRAAASCDACCASQQRMRK